MKRNLPIAIGLLALVVAFALTQFRLLPDSRAVEPVEAIDGLRERDDLNVVFILIDTLRADRLGVEGYERPTSPHIDALARQGIRFDRHRSQSSWTKTSMASIWTGLTPIRSGILRFNQGLPESALMPAEILREKGFRTAGLWRNGWVAPTFGFEQGFSVYHRPQPEAIRLAARRREVDDPGARLPGSDVDLTTGALEFLRVNADERFFLYLHYMDLHQYASDAESAIFGTTYSDLYDNAIHWTDRHVKAMIDGLEDAGVLDRTIVVIGSDHGEAFGEHGKEGHAKDLYAEVIDVPWILSLPFALSKGVVVETPTANVDIWPTIFDLLGIDGMDGVDGRSRLPEIRAAAGLADGEAIAGEDTVQPTFAHLDRNWGQTTLPYNPVIAVVEDPYEFVHWPNRPEADELYDIESDPRQTENLIEQGVLTPVIDRLRDRVASYLDSPEAPWGGGVESVELDEMEKGQLRALGYVVE